MAIKQEKPYAYVSATFSSWGSSAYGHIYVDLYGVMRYSNASIRISCQTDLTVAQSYAWDHGIAPGSSLVGLETAKKGYYLLRRIRKHLDQEQADHGYPLTFREYVLRVLRGSGIRTVYLNPVPNKGLSGELTELPVCTLPRDTDGLLDVLDTLEKQLLSGRC